MSEQKLTQKLIEVQRSLKAPKGQFNKFGKYYYRSAEDILEAVKPLNAEHGLLLTIKDEPVLIGDWHYIKATASLTDGTDTHEVTAYARESMSKKGMDDSQITGTASSYARKYALNGLYLIDDTKDADTDEYKNQNDKAPKKKKATSEQKNTLNKLVSNYMNARGVDGEDAHQEMMNWALNQAGAKSLDQLNDEQADIAINKMQTMINRLQAG